MRVVIAPDKFKGSLTAPDIVAHLTAGLRSVKRAAGQVLDVDGIPVADGGEGTLDAAVGSGFTRRTAIVSGPTGEPLEAEFAVRGREAIIEMATASGLAVLPGGIRDALGSTSLGTGQLIRAALDAGCRKIILGVGGSANTDGGAGVLQGLGARFIDSDGNEIPAGGAALARLKWIDFSGFDTRLEETRFVLASDVDNPLLGPDGAAAVFGPQKGASSEDVRTLDSALGHFVDVLSHELGFRAQKAAEAPGAGAAGGVGYAAIAVLAASRRPGIDVVLEFTDLAHRLVGADLVITGEGSLDEQSLLGKTPMGVARAAALAGVPVIAVCGRTTLTAGQLRAAGFQSTFALTSIEENVEKCIAEAGRLLETVGTTIGGQLGPDSPWFRPMESTPSKEYLNA
ncbi:glycerate kinase [Arthrobacter sp. AL08]|uniref:glycerate kinase n=1 Tax=Micrococcaceae TaxID=1268 RepID=UPI001CFF985C|nr:MULTISPECIES: glycerate kinase [Micrococcaceae]MCB5283953.1 Glycerate 2-kinase [Arthrobacter sp. ES1]MDI3243375.1 glycerate kinase [Arthrobacter sp. AL05]MDI3279374.1 glycerate kinase [Arthrobacter sp. AL08]MDJ0353950.1 glycerate kinase [Pseudarthrobacter sp. PH31-O2]WGZ80954.1 glycerate kinase [Arthrobacter sp. EM1]